MQHHYAQSRAMKKDLSYCRKLEAFMLERDGDLLAAVIKFRECEIANDTSNVDRLSDRLKSLDKAILASIRAQTAVRIGKVAKTEKRLALIEVAKTLPLGSFTNQQLKDMTGMRPISLERLIKNKIRRINNERI